MKTPAKRIPLPTALGLQIFWKLLAFVPIPTPIVASYGTTWYAESHGDGHQDVHFAGNLCCGGTQHLNQTHSWVLQVSAPKRKHISKTNRKFLALAMPMWNLCGVVLQML